MARRQLVHFLHAYGLAGRGYRKLSEWHVYLLKCADGTFYCGIARDLEARLAQHNGQEPGGARYTRGRRPVYIAAQAGGLSHSQALRLEAKIKKLPKQAKLTAFQKLLLCPAPI